MQQNLFSNYCLFINEWAGKVRGRRSGATGGRVPCPYSNFRLKISDFKNPGVSERKKVVVLAALKTPLFLLLTDFFYF
jgi:hypothetical protein